MANQVDLDHYKGLVDQQTLMKNKDFKSSFKRASKFTGSPVVTTLLVIAALGGIVAIGDNISALGIVRSSQTYADDVNALPSITSKMSKCLHYSSDSTQSQFMFWILDGTRTDATNCFEQTLPQRQSLVTKAADTNPGALAVPGSVISQSTFSDLPVQLRSSVEQRITTKSPLQGTLYNNSTAKAGYNYVLKTNDGTTLPIYLGGFESSLSEGLKVQINSGAVVPSSTGNKIIVTNTSGSINTLNSTAAQWTGDFTVTVVPVYKRGTSLDSSLASRMTTNLVNFYNTQSGGKFHLSSTVAQPLALDFNCDQFVGQDLNDNNYNTNFVAYVWAGNTLNQGISCTDNRMVRAKAIIVTSTGSDGSREGNGLVHEFGHALGLNHSSDINNIMSPSAVSYPPFPALTTAQKQQLGWVAGSAPTPTQQGGGIVPGAGGNNNGNTVTVGAVGGQAYISCPSTPVTIAAGHIGSIRLYANGVGFSASIPTRQGPLGAHDEGRRGIPTAGFRPDPDPQYALVSMNPGRFYDLHVLVDSSVAPSDYNIDVEGQAGSYKDFNGDGEPDLYSLFSTCKVPIHVVDQSSPSQGCGLNPLCWIGGWLGGGNATGLTPRIGLRSADLYPFETWILANADGEDTDPGHNNCRDVGDINETVIIKRGDPLPGTGLPAPRDVTYIHHKCQHSAFLDSDQDGRGNSSITVPVGTGVYVYWDQNYNPNSTATSCTMSPMPWTGIDGTQIITINAPMTLTLTCRDAANNSLSVRGTINVTGTVTGTNPTTGLLQCQPSRQTVANIPQDFPHPTSQQVSITCTTSGVSGSVNYTMSPDFHFIGDAKQLSCLKIVEASDGMTMNFGNRPAGATTFNFNVITFRGKACGSAYEGLITAKASNGDVVGQQFIYLEDHALTCGAQGYASCPIAGGDIVFDTLEVHLNRGQTVEVGFQSKWPEHFILDTRGLYYGVPNPSIATASLVGKKVRITGVGAGQTAVVVVSNEYNIGVPGPGGYATGRSNASLKIVVDGGNAPGGTEPTPTPGPVELECSWWRQILGLCGEPLPTPAATPTATLPSNGGNPPADCMSGEGITVCLSRNEASATVSSLGQNYIILKMDGSRIQACSTGQSNCSKSVNLSPGSQHSLTGQVWNDTTGVTRAFGSDFTVQ